jgi:ferredoxin-NADP reductase
VATTITATRGGRSVTTVTDLPTVGRWQVATVTDIRRETSRVKTFRLALGHPSRHMAGQHYSVKLTAPDGYMAERSYSVASPPDASGEIELTVERLQDGEVSMFLHDVVVVGDTLEVRGPIGGWFVWDGSPPALLIGGGTGIVPVMAMLRLSRRTANQSRAHLVVSVRSPEELIYASELMSEDSTIIYTRQAPEGYGRPPAHISVEDLASLVPSYSRTYICGSSGFAEAATSVAMNAGAATETIRIERFGATG